MIAHINQSLRDRLNKFVAKNKNNCWEWTGHVSKQGYGKMGVKGKMELAHRVSYREFVGEIPEGLDLDHLCRNRKCVNPKHLEPVTRKVNVIRGEGKTAANAKKTHCVRGHEFTNENTEIVRSSTRVQRRCKICARATWRKYWLNKKSV